MIRRLLSGVPFVLLCLSPDQGGGGGSSTEPKPAEPTGETLADKFESAKNIIKDYFLAQSDTSLRPKIFGMTASPVDTMSDLLIAAQ